MALFLWKCGGEEIVLCNNSKKWIVLENGVIQENTNYSQNPDDPDLIGQQAGTTTGGRNQ